jgi:RNA polymerase sigma-70 factor (ECF subfamily)
MFTIDEERTLWFMRSVLPHEPSLKAWLSSKKSIGFDVEDIVQETYSILAGLESVSEIRFPRAYLFQVAHSLIVRNIRRARVVSIQAMEDLAVDDWADDAPSPETIAIGRDELGRIAEAIAAMPQQTGRAFTLRRIHGLSQREIAREMRLSENTVEKHISRGIRFLTEWFGSGGRPGGQSSKAAQPEICAAHDNKRVQSEH